MNQADLNTQERPWNMNAAFLMQLDRRRDEKAQAAIKGDLWAWYRCSMEILNSVRPVVTQTELEPINALQKEITRMMASQAMALAKTSFQESGKLQALHRTEEKLQELDDAIMKLLFDYRLVFIRAKKKSIQDYLEEDDSLE